MVKKGTFPWIGSGFLMAMASMASLPNGVDAAQDITAAVTMTLEEARRPPLVIALAVDEVGIAPADLQRTQEQVMALLGLLPARTEVLVASFAGEARIVIPPTSDRDVLARAIKAIKPTSSGVALPDGLFDIVDALGRLNARARAVLLVSAGRVREGDLQFEDPLNAATSRSIPIIALGVGQGDGKLLRRIARITGGEYIRLEVADASMLAAVVLPTSKGAATLAEGLDPDSAPTKASPVGRTSAGLLGAAAAFLIVGSLLLLAVLALLVRRMRRSAAPEAGPAQTGAAVVSHAGPSGAPVLRDAVGSVDDEGLEKTLVVNANPTLRALSGPGAGKNFALSALGQTSIGRSRRNDIVVPEDAASAQHCRIDREGDSFVLHDLGATNGTWVNEARTERAILQHGDRLKVGETVFTVSLFGDRS